MLYVFHGSDETMVANKRIALLAALRKKRADAEVFLFDAQTFDAALLDDVLSAQGLFFAKHVIVLHKVCEKAEHKEVLLERAEVLGKVEHLVILQEGVLDVASVRAFAQHAHEITEHKKVKKETKGNPFALAEALARKDTKALWCGCVEQLQQGAEPEMLVGTLHWQVRMLLLAKQGVSVEYAGVKSYALEKAARAAGNSTLEELRALSRSLVTVYHDAHRGMFPLKTGLERWCLGVK
jgi:DNA polymerase III delta subunit